MKNHIVKPRVAQERTIINTGGMITIIPKGGVIPFQSSNSSHWSAQPQLT